MGYKGEGNSPGDRWLDYNRKVGRAFQQFALSVMGQPGEFKENFDPYFSPDRYGYTEGEMVAIVPDSVQSKRIGREGEVGKEYINSIFIEVKAVDGVIGLRYSKGQIAGYLDVARQYAEAPNRDPPSVIFITTSNTTIGADVLKDASSYDPAKQVAVWQIVAEEALDGEKGVNNLRLGPPVLLNKDIFGNNDIEVPRPPSRAGSLPPPRLVPAKDNDPQHPKTVEPL
jgi:hypothetical protein